MVVIDFDGSGVLTKIICELILHHLDPQRQRGVEEHSWEINVHWIRAEASFCPQLHTKHSHAVWMTRYNNSTAFPVTPMIVF